MFVLGITGGSGSGKSTLAAALAERLSDRLTVEVLGADRFFHKELPTMVSPDTGEVLEDYNCPDTADYPAMLDYIRGKNDVDLLIVEGNGVLYFEEMRNLMDLKVFVDLPIEERMYRRIVRNMEAGRGTMEEIASFYLHSARYSEAKWLLPTKRYADIILDGRTWNGKGMDLLVHYILHEEKGV